MTLDSDNLVLCRAIHGLYVAVNGPCCYHLVVLALLVLSDDGMFFPYRLKCQFLKYLNTYIYF